MNYSKATSLLKITSLIDNFFNKELRLIIIIGRGNGGTRAISQTLSESGVYMGTTNNSGDLIPPKNMYDAAKIVGKYVKITGVTPAKLANDWDFSNLIDSEPTILFKFLVNKYLFKILTHNGNRGWKLPETNLCYPWIVKMFPEAYYIHWTRDPRDALLGDHLTDKIASFKAPAGTWYSANILKLRMQSWLYQMKIVQATPKPKNFIHIKFEDFCLHQEDTLSKLSDFLGIELKAIPIKEGTVGRSDRIPLPISDEELKAFGY
jgi:hypothetical protein